MSVNVEKPFRPRVADGLVGLARALFGSHKADKEAAESQLQQYRKALRPAFRILEVKSVEKISGRYYGHKENRGHPFDWALTLDAETVASGMSVKMCGFLSACANAIQELRALQASADNPEVRQ